MKVKIEYVKGVTTKEDLLALKNAIDKKNINGVNKVEVSTQKPKKGEMGAGILPALSALIGSATQPLTSLVMVLVEMVKLKRSEIKITGSSGAELYISGKVKEKDLHEAIEKFYAQEKANVKASVKRTKQDTTTPPPPSQTSKENEKK